MLTNWLKSSEKYIWTIPISTTIFYWVCIYILTLETGMKPNLAYVMVSDYGMEWCQNIHAYMSIVIPVGFIIYFLLNIIRFSIPNNNNKTKYKYIIMNFASIVIWYYFVVLFDNRMWGWFLE